MDMRHAPPREKAAYLAREGWSLFKGPVLVVGVVALLIAGMGVLELWANLHNRVPRPYVSDVSDDAALVPRILPELGPVTEARWRWSSEWSTYGGRGGGRSGGTPFLRKRQDLTFEGFALLSPARVAALLGEDAGGRGLIWYEVTNGPAVPQALARFRPPRPTWLESGSFRSQDRDVAWTAVWLDKGSGVVYFVQNRRCPKDRMPCDAWSFPA
ncbi:MAG TPA: hypothetical protein VFT95_04790 [Micromonosporaceae bacterium]|nr:hypothetical protein [Micromonosporaceae bacterium]